MPKTAEIDQTWPFFPLPTSAVALFLYLRHRQSTRGPLISRRMQNTETRDRMYACGVSRRVPFTQGRAFAGMPQPLRVFSQRSRVCGVSLLATGQGNMRVLLTVADNHKSTTAKGWHGKMAMLLRFAPFRGQVQVQSSANEMPMTRNRANRKTVGRPKLEASTSCITVGQCP